MNRGAESVPLSGAADLSECRRVEVPEHSPLDIRLVGGAHEPDDDALYPRCAKLGRARAIQDFAKTFTDWVKIGFWILAFHEDSPFSSCSRGAGLVQIIKPFLTTQIAR